MHQRARGHEAEPKNSHFLCPKTKKKNEGERRNWGESCTNVQEDTRQSLRTPIFYVQKRKRKTREKGATGESMHEGARGHEAERSHSHFLYSTTERNYNQRIQGLYTQYYEEICTHIFFFCAKMRRRKEKCALDSRENRNPAFVLLFFWKN